MNSRPHHARAFPPIANRAARVLVLGSLPGRESLAQQQYYAHPRNSFWRIMGELYGAGPDLAYAQRSARLAAAGIALWDVLAQAERPGSLDAAILRHSERANNFAVFLAAHPRLQLIVFNGATAAVLFRRHALPTLGAAAVELPRVILPSTSPAHAGISYAIKLQRWRAALPPAASPRQA